MPETVWAELRLARTRGRASVIRGDVRSVPDARVDIVVCSMGLMLVVPVQAARQGGSGDWPVRDAT